MFVAKRSTGGIRFGYVLVFFCVFLSVLLLDIHSLFAQETGTSRKVAAVDPKIYGAYVGQYELAPNFMLTITKENDRLFAQATGQEKVEIFPESPEKFYYTMVDAQITFVKNDKGVVTELVLHQRGDHHAKKIK